MKSKTFSFSIFLMILSNLILGAFIFINLVNTLSYGVNPPNIFLLSNDYFSGNNTIWVGANDADGLDKAEIRLDDVLLDTQFPTVLERNITRSVDVFSFYKSQNERGNITDFRTIDGDTFNVSNKHPYKKFKGYFYFYINNLYVLEDQIDNATFYITYNDSSNLDWVKWRLYNDDTHGYDQIYQDNTTGSMHTINFTITNFSPYVEDKYYETLLSFTISDAGAQSHWQFDQIICEFGIKNGGILGADASFIFEIDTMPYTDGVHNLSMRVYDNGGNWNQTSINIIINNLMKPDFKAFYPDYSNLGINHNTTLLMEVEAQQYALDSVWVYNPLSGDNETIAENIESYGTFNLNASFTTNTQGIYRFYAYSNDTQGNIDYIYCDVTWNILLIPPNIIVNYVNLTQPYSTTIEIKIEVGKTEYNLENFWYVINNVTHLHSITENASSEIFWINFHSEFIGKIYLQLYANDTMGNTNNLILKIEWTLKAGETYKEYITEVRTKLGVEAEVIFPFWEILLWILINTGWSIMNFFWTRKARKKKVVKKTPYETTKKS